MGDLIFPSGSDRPRSSRLHTLDVEAHHLISDSLVDWLDKQGLSDDFSSAGYAALRSQFKAIPPKDEAELRAIVEDFLQPAIQQTRRYQTLQALINCTRKSLLPNPETITAEMRAQWEEEIRQLEMQGIR